MRKINYSLIVSDFDGTLVNDDGTISNENKQHKLINSRKDK